MDENTLFYGDNLEVLRRHVADESVDLVYLDPPFKSEQDYNVLFAEQNGSRAAAQIKAFEDTWRWDQDSAKAYQEVVETGPPRVSQVMQAFRLFLGGSDMMAYLAMMAPRLVELRRALKPTGSVYLHCDPTASHYLKILMDAVFGPVNFKNEIIWKRTSAHSDSRTCGNTHDLLLLYTSGDEFVWNKQFQEYDQAYVESHYRYLDSKGRRHRTDNLTAIGLRGGGYEYEWHGVKKIWRLPKERMAQLEKENRIRYTRTGAAEYIRYLDEMPGVPLQDLWTDIPPINPQAKERLGYPTQKPEALLARIIDVSSNKGDTVLDPFCGCGTAVVVAERLKRKWIGIDVTHLAVALMKHRLRDAFGGKVKYRVMGEPVSLPDAKTLAKQNRYQFQWWALGLVGARPVEQKKGVDRGIDGRLYFHDEPDNARSKTKQIVISVKSGKVGVKDVRDLRGVLERETAQIGVLISMEKPTSAMRQEATGGGFYKSPWRKHPVMQILTVEELLKDKKIDYPDVPGVNVTFKRAPKAKCKRTEHPELEYQEQ